MTFGEWLKKTRLARRETQGNAARAVGVSRQTWNSWERGTWIPQGRGFGPGWDHNVAALAGRLERWCGTPAAKIGGLIRASHEAARDAAP